MMAVFRWLLIVPAAIVAWYAAFLVGLLMNAGLNSLCSSDEQISGVCMAPWYDVASMVVICFGAGLAAVLILLVCTLLAPAHKPKVAVATFVVGAAVAALLGVSTGLYIAFVGAIVAGAIELWLLLLWFTPKQASEGAST